MKNVSSYLRFIHLNEGKFYEPTEEELNRFWNFVAHADWESDHNYDRIKKLLKKNYPHAERRSFENSYSYLLDKLDKEFREDWKNWSFYLGDDAWWDLRAEVIGRGKEFYNNITADNLMRMGRSGDYKENFGYSFGD